MGSPWPTNLDRLAASSFLCYNSEGVVGDTIDRTTSVCEQAGIDYELILVNDGSPDDSWEIISKRAAGQ